jgi:hypothetical protein
MQEEQEPASIIPANHNRLNNIALPLNNNNPLEHTSNDELEAIDQLLTEQRHIFTNTQHTTSNKKNIPSPPPNVTSQFPTLRLATV